MGFLGALEDSQVPLAATWVFAARGLLALHRSALRGSPLFLSCLFSCQAPGLSGIYQINEGQAFPFAPLPLLVFPGPRRPGCQRPRVRLEDTFPQGKALPCWLGTWQDSYTSWARSFPAHPLLLGAMPDPHTAAGSSQQPSAPVGAAPHAGHHTRLSLSVFTNDRDNDTYPAAFPNGAETCLDRDCTLISPYECQVPLR